MAKHILSLTFHSVKKKNYFMQVSYWLIFSIEKQVRLFVYFVQMDYFHCFFVNRQTNNKRLVSNFCILYIYMLKRKDIYIFTKNGNNGKRQFMFVWLQTENRNSKLLFICCKRKQKLEVSFSWSANNKQYCNRCFRKWACLWFLLSLFPIGLHLHYS
jgi:hypothetical protein